MSGFDFCERTEHLPIVRFAFLIGDATYVADRCACDAGEPPSSVPEWLEEPLRQWESPQDPITFSGRVRKGFRDEAMEYLLR